MMSAVNQCFCSWPVMVLTVSKEMSLCQMIYICHFGSNLLFGSYLFFSLNLRSTVKGIILLWSNMNSCRCFPPKPVGLKGDMCRNAVVWKSLHDTAVELISQCCCLPCSPDCLESINWIKESEAIAASFCKYCKSMKRLSSPNSSSDFKLMFGAQHE